MKIKPLQNCEITLSFTDIGKSCHQTNLTSQICLNAIREYKILAKISVIYIIQQN